MRMKLAERADAQRRLAQLKQRDGREDA